MISMGDTVNNTDMNATIPWYRHTYVWLLIVFPAVAVVGGIATLFIAINTFDGLVVDDYYKRGLEINRTVERDHAAEAMALAASLQINPGKERFRVVLAGNNLFHAPDEVRIGFFNATRSGQDQSVIMHLLGNGIYEGELPVLPPGIWNVQIEARNWRILDRWRNN